MKSFKDIQNSRKTNWKYLELQKKSRHEQVQAFHKMVCGVLKELRKADDTDFCPFDWINSTLYEEQGDLGWKMGSAFESGISINPEFDKANNLSLLNVYFRGHYCASFPNEVALRETIAYLLAIP